MPCGACYWRVLKWFSLTERSSVPHAAGMPPLPAARFPLAIDSIRGRDLDCLPERMLILADSIGLENALRLVDRFGGHTILIPKLNQDRSASRCVLFGRLRSAIGNDGAEKMCAQHGGDRFTVPVCQELRHRLWRRALLREFEVCRGKRGTLHGVRILSARYSLTERWVYALLARSRAEDEQRLALDQRRREVA